MAEDEYLDPLNRRLESIGSATNFQHYVNNVYNSDFLPLMAKSTQERYRSVIKNYLMPAFGKKCLRDLKPKILQHYFTGLVSSPLSHESKDKIRDVLSSILQTAIYPSELLAKNPMEHIRMPPEKFDTLINLIAEPFATMIYVAVYTGLRVSELIGLRWDDVLDGHLTIDERYYRGDWSAPKSDASNATLRR